MYPKILAGKKWKFYSKVGLIGGILIRQQTHKPCMHALIHSLIYRLEILLREHWTASLIQEKYLFSLDIHVHTCIEASLSHMHNNLAKRGQRQTSPLHLLQVLNIKCFLYFYFAIPRLIAKSPNLFIARYTCYTICYVWKCAHECICTHIYCM